MLPLLVFTFATTYASNIGLRKIGYRPLARSVSKPCQSLKGHPFRALHSSQFKKNRLGAVVSRSSISQEETQISDRKKTTYGLWPALPLQPGGERRITKRYEIAAGKIYGFEQIFGTLDVLVNIRMTVTVLSDGGLLVYSPVAATEECIEMVKELEGKHGPVKHIVLPTTAVEHKVFFGPFAKKFKDAELWVVPGQWSFPLNLPLSALGLFPRKATILPLDSSDSDAPWLKDFDYNILKFDLGLAPFVEAAFFHKPSKTLLITDAVVFAPDEAPEIIQDDPSPLLFRAKDNARDPTPDTPENRQKGWAKTVLFSLFIQPENVRASLIKDYPALLAWDDGWKSSWEIVKNRLFVSPVIQILVFSQAPKTIRKWVDNICKWPFTSIVPCHFSAPIEAGPKEFRKAIETALEGTSPPVLQQLENGNFAETPLQTPKKVPDFQDWIADMFEGLQPKLKSSGYEIGLPWKELRGDFELLRTFEKGIRATGVVKGPDKEKDPK